MDALIDWFTALPATLIANPFWGALALVSGALMTGGLLGLALIRFVRGPKES